MKPERNLGAAKPPWRKAKRNSGPHRLKSRNRRMRTRMYGGVTGKAGDRLPMSIDAAAAARDDDSELKLTLMGKRPRKTPANTVRP